MACLIDVKNNKPVYLATHHSFGRLAAKVNTCIASPEISRIHALVEWEMDHWSIRDVSINGTWLNQERLGPQKKYKLNEGDWICFTPGDKKGFMVKDLSPPCDMLVPYGERGQNPVDVIELSPYLLLPEETPVIAVYYDTSQSAWFYDDLTQDDTTSIARPLMEFDLLTIDNKQWQFITCNSEPVTRQISPNTIDSLSLSFQLSVDEETTQLTVKTPWETVDLQARIHHYLALTLARVRVEDAEKGMDESAEGWVYAEDLAKALGIDIYHLNIQIHRARKQFSELFADFSGVEKFIERQNGKIRLGVRQLEIYKGQLLQYAIQNETVVVNLHA